MSYLAELRQMYFINVTESLPCYKSVVFALARAKPSESDGVCCEPAV
jgi:hypothetical protein